MSSHLQPSGESTESGSEVPKIPESRPCWSRTPYVDMEKVRREQTVQHGSGEPLANQRSTRLDFLSEIPVVIRRAPRRSSFDHFPQNEEINYDTDAKRSSSFSSGLLSSTTSMPTSTSSGPSSPTSGPSSVTSNDVAGGGSALRPCGTMRMSQVRMEEVMSSSSKALDFLSTRVSSPEISRRAPGQQHPAKQPAPRSTRRAVYENVEVTHLRRKPVWELTPIAPPTQPVRPVPPGGCLLDFCPTPPPPPAEGAATAIASAPYFNVNFAFPSMPGKASERRSPEPKRWIERTDEKQEEEVKPPVPPRSRSPGYLNVETGPDVTAPPKPCPPAPRPASFLVDTPGDSDEVIETSL